MLVLNDLWINKKQNRKGPWRVIPSVLSLGQSCLKRPEKCFVRSVLKNCQHEDLVAHPKNVPLHLGKKLSLGAEIDLVQFKPIIFVLSKMDKNSLFPSFS